MGILWPEKFPLKNKLLEIKRNKNLKQCERKDAFKFYKAWQLKCWH